MKILIERDEYYDYIFAREGDPKYYRWQADIRKDKLKRLESIFKEYYKAQEYLDSVKQNQKVAKNGD